MDILLSPTSNLQLQEHDVQNSSVKKTYSRLRLGAATSFGGRHEPPSPSLVTSRPRLTVRRLQFYCTLIIERTCHTSQNNHRLRSQSCNKWVTTLSGVSLLVYTRKTHSRQYCNLYVAQSCYSVIGDKPFLWSKPKFDPP